MTLDELTTLTSLRIVDTTNDIDDFRKRLSEIMITRIGIKDNHMDELSIACKILTFIEVALNEYREFVVDNSDATNLIEERIKQAEEKQIELRNNIAEINAKLDIIIDNMR